MGGLRVAHFVWLRRRAESVFAAPVGSSHPAEGRSTVLHHKTRHQVGPRSRSARMSVLLSTQELRRRRRCLAFSANSASPSSNAARRISRCSASAERPCAAARCLSARTIRSSTFRTVNCGMSRPLSTMYPQYGRICSAESRLTIGLHASKVNTTLTEVYTTRWAAFGAPVSSARRERPADLAGLRRCAGRPRRTPHRGPPATRHGRGRRIGWPASRPRWR